MTVPRSLEEWPAHSWKPNQHPYICQFPERPVDNEVKIDFRCRNCMIAAIASLRAGINPIRTTIDLQTMERTCVRLSEAVKRNIIYFPDLEKMMP